MIRAGCYLRDSTDRQDLENQRPDIEALCKQRGWEPVWYIDHAKSGARTDGRTAYLDLMRDARRGRLQVVVFWKLDRLGRKAAQLLLDVDELTQAGLSVVSCQDNIDTSTAMGRAAVGMMAVFAQLEREQTVERIGASYRRKKARAESIGQKVRWGSLDVWARAKRDGRLGDLEAAVGEIQAGRMSQRQAAAAYDFPRSSLQSALAGKPPLPDGGVPPPEA